MSKNTFASKLKKALKGYNLTRLAEELDIPSSLIHDWISASRKPSMDNLKRVKRLCDHLHLNFEELVLGDEYKEEKTLTTVTFTDGKSRYSVSITKLKD